MKQAKFLSGMLAILLVGALFTACKKDYNNNGTSNSTAAVSIGSSSFSNANLQVTSGTKVTWKNDDNTTHTVTADDSSFDSGDIQPGASFSHTFSSVGTFAYHDKLHTSLTGVVVVVASTSSHPSY